MHLRICVGDWVRGVIVLSHRECSAFKGCQLVTAEQWRPDPIRLVLPRHLLPHSRVEALFPFVAFDGPEDCGHLHPSSPCPQARHWGQRRPHGPSAIAPAWRSGISSKSLGGNASFPKLSLSMKAMYFRFNSAGPNRLSSGSASMGQKSLLTQTHLGSPWCGSSSIGCLLLASVCWPP